MNEPKNTIFNDLNCSSHNGIFIGDEELIDSNIDFYISPNGQLTTHHNALSSTTDDALIRTKELRFTKPSSDNVHYELSMSQVDYQSNCILSSKNEYQNDKNKDHKSESNLNSDEKSTKDLAIKYNELSENKQNELEILKKLEFFLLKYKWNAKVMEIDNGLHSMNTILECDNSCESKLNLTNLVVRFKVKIDRLLIFNEIHFNEFVNEYLGKLIHLILSKHKCAARCNELSLILIRNFFKQFHLPELRNIAEDKKNQIFQLRLVDLLKRKLNLHLNEAHSCSSLISLNKLPNININSRILSPVACSNSQYDKNSEDYGIRDDCLNEESFFDNLVSDTSSNCTDLNKNDAGNMHDDNLNGEENYSFGNLAEQIEFNKRDRGDTETSFYDENDDDLNEEDLFFVKKEQKGFDTKNCVSNANDTNNKDSESNESNRLLQNSTITSASSPSSQEKNDQGILSTSPNSDFPKKSGSSIIKSLANKQKAIQESPSENHLILKAINRRKLQLACPICSSCVVNMSDHLVKKHSIKDRNERKYLMDLVRRKYLSMGKSNSNPQVPPVIVQSVKSAPIMPIITVPPSLPIPSTSPLSDNILAASLTMLQHQQHQLEQSNQIINQTNQKLRNLVQNIPNSGIIKPSLNNNESIQQNLQIIEQITNKQINYNNNIDNIDTDNDVILNSNNGIKITSQSPNKTTNVSSNTSQIATTGSYSTASATSNGLQTNNNRKFIKCPICLDENKYFVNISDHLIKIHHLVTSEMRKPILKQIRENSNLCINKSQFDLVFSSTLNKKIKLDQSLSIQLSNNTFQEQINDQQCEHQSVHIQSQDFRNSEHEENEQKKQFQSQQLQKQAKNTIELIKDQASYTASDQPITNCLIDNTDENSKLQNEKKSEKLVLKQKYQETNDALEDNLSLDSDKDFSQEGEISTCNDSTSPKQSFSNFNSNSLGANLLVTDEDIADYSDLISLNYEPFFSNNSNCINNGKTYLNYDFDFDTNDLYVPSNINTDMDFNNTNVKSNNDAADENEKNESQLNNVYNEDIKNLESPDSKKRKFTTTESNFQKYQKAYKKIRNSPRNFNENTLPGENNTPEDIFEASKMLFSSVQKNVTEMSKDNNNVTNPPQVQVENYCEKKRFEQGLRRIGCKSQSNTETILKLCDSQSSSSSNQFTSSYRELITDLEQNKDNQELTKNEIWSKLNDMEESLNDTINGFNKFTESLTSQLKFFSSQFHSNLIQIKSMKKFLIGTDIKTTHNRDNLDTSNHNEQKNF